MFSVPESITLFRTSRFNGRIAGFSALRQIVIGLIATAFTLWVGRLLGVSVS